MGWSALFDRSHIVKGVPVDADIELQCNKCGTRFRTVNAYHVGLFAGPLPQPCRRRPLQPRYRRTQAD